MQSTKRAPISCQECRRSKTKCNKLTGEDYKIYVLRITDGVSGKVSTERTEVSQTLRGDVRKLTSEAASLRVRVRELERALGDAGVALPLTTDTTFGRTDECWWVANAVGSLEISDDEEPHIAHVETKVGNTVAPGRDPLITWASWDASLPRHITRLVNAFPFGPSGPRPSPLIFKEYMPSLEEALSLTRAYYDESALFFNPLPEIVYMSEILEPIYISDSAPDLTRIHPHRLSAFFMIIAMGAYYRQEDPIKLQRMFLYRAIGRATFCLEGVFNGASAATVQALLLLVASLASMLIILDEEHKDETTLMLGICSRLAITVGIDRDADPAQFTPQEIQNRRWAYWELCNYENINSLVIGVQPTLWNDWMDTPLPDDLEPYLTKEGNVEMGFHAWKHRFTRDCDSLALRFMFSKDLPPYSDLQRASKFVESFPAPSHLRFPYGDLDRITEPILPDDITMPTDEREAQDMIWVEAQHASVCGYIHRRYFIEALRDDTEDALDHEYGDSVRAIYDSARRTIYSIACMLQFHDDLGHKRWKYYANWFFGAVTGMAMIVLEKPRTSLVPEFARWLEYAIPVFVRATARSTYRFLDTIAIVLSRLLGQVRRRVQEPDAPRRASRNGAAVKGNGRGAARNKSTGGRGGAKKRDAPALGSASSNLGGRPHRKIVPRHPTNGCLGDEFAQANAGRELEEELERATGMAPPKKSTEDKPPNPHPMTWTPGTATRGSWMGTIAAGIQGMSTSTVSNELVLDDSMLDMLVDAMDNGAGESAEDLSQGNGFGAYTTGTHWLEQLGGW
ncbi:hypothetical protein HDZ31DRAFT_81654 [Schizophyllum fasciatum]